jgi:energy-coupling factor transport system ATP-binding protein
MQIEVKNVSYTYDYGNKETYKALDNVSFSVEKGDFLAIVGKTGAGKSTLIQMLNGLLLPDEGEVDIDDFIVSKDHKKRSKKLFLLRKKVGMVFQFPEYQLFEETVLKDVMFGPKNFGLKDDEAMAVAKSALTSVHIDEKYYNRSPFELSGGEKRKVAIAGILASKPEIMVLDEPTAGLDPLAKVDIMNLIKELHENGTTIILVTHDMDVVMNYASKVVVLNDAKLMKVTTPDALFNEPDVEKYSLEIPTLYKFKRILANEGFKKDLKSVNDLDSLIDAITEGKNNG